MTGASEIDLRASLVNIYGPGTSGKSNFLKWLLAKEPYHRHLIIDPMQEYDEEKYNVYHPDALEYSTGGNEELNHVLGELYSMPRELRPRYVVIDEAANYLPGGNKPMGAMVNRMIFHNTHIYPGMTLVSLCRRAGDLNTTLRETANHSFVFGGRGSTTMRAYKDLAEDLPDAVRDLEEYHFIHVNERGEMTLFAPVDEMPEYERI